MSNLPKEKSLPIAYIGDYNEFNRVWHALKRDMNEGRIVDIVIMARTEVREGQKELYPNCKYLTSKYWAGSDSCIGILGMLQYMIGEVMDFIRREE